MGQEGRDAAAPAGPRRHATGLAHDARVPLAADGEQPVAVGVGDLQQHLPRAADRGASAGGRIGLLPDRLLHGLVLHRDRECQLGVDRASLRCTRRRSDRGDRRDDADARARAGCPRRRPRFCLRRTAAAPDRDAGRRLRPLRALREGHVPLVAAAVRLHRLHDVRTRHRRHAHAVRRADHEHRGQPGRHAGADPGLVRVAARRHRRRGTCERRRERGRARLHADRAGSREEPA
jgi:hypothetical protein